LGEIVQQSSTVDVWLNSVCLAVFSDGLVGILKEHRSYVLIKPKDSKAITEACIKVYKKKYKKTKKKIFRWKDCIRKYFELYESIL